jgi:hypothetical protein
MTFDLVWIYKHLLKPLGLVFWMQTSDDVPGWNSEFPTKIAVVRIGKYLEQTRK